MGVMTPTDIGLLVLAVFAWAIVGVLHVVGKAWHHDEVFTDTIPGNIPPNPSIAPRERLKGLSQEYDGEIAVAFSPPRGLTPGLVGTVIDGQVDSYDVTATLVDLAVRGHLAITAVPADKAPSVARKHYARRPEGDEPPKNDWVLTRSADHAYDTLTDRERRLLDGLFHSSATVRMSQLDHGSLQAIREDQKALYTEMVARKWYPRHPQQRGGSGCLLIGGGLVLAVLFVLVRHTLPGIVAAVLVLGAAVVASRVLRGRTPRTALGSAVRIQALGFKKYLQTAEASQFSFEEAAGIFSRYLPYAMVFGVAQHWAKVFGDLARQAKLEGVGVNFDLTWFSDPTLSVLDGLSDVLWWDSFDGDLDLVDGFVELGGGLVGGLGDLATGLGDAATGIGDFMGSLDFMDGLGNGCDADGCGDVAGCLDF